MLQENGSDYGKKREAWQRLRQALSLSCEKMSLMAETDERLDGYLRDLASEDHDNGEDCNTRHNYYEILGALRFVRCLNTYYFDAEKVKKVVKLREYGGT